MKKSKAPALRAFDKWHEAAEAGFQIVPDVLLKNQAELGLSATDLVVLLNLTMHWWYKEQRPFPRSTTIARRMGVDVRTIQRSLVKLRERRLINQVVEQTPGGEERQVCDLSGLQQQLSEIAKTDPTYLSRQIPSEAKDNDL
ncbi:MAG: helix-turn-helix domain-containing protein [Alphaproteobacteria bacterium]|nr:helix-turn-helix domain-containing protein [Alphaproteobacteria bacterium]MBF0355763.1 helix-turn-helix domain-containing protein [Alphaproteobacteria bacterium]